MLIPAYWLCSNSDKYGEVYNIAVDDTCTGGEALDMLISKSTKNHTKELDDPERDETNRHNITDTK